MPRPPQKETVRRLTVQQQGGLVRPSIYTRDGNYYHDECAAGVVLDMLEEDPRTERWVRNFQFTSDAEADLDRIAHYMKIDRDDPEQCAAARFPERVHEVPDPPSLCSACLHFFARRGAESEQSDV